MPTMTMKMKIMMMTTTINGDDNDHEDEGWGHDDSPVLSFLAIIILIMKRTRLMMIYRNADGKLKILEPDASRIASFHGKY